MTPEDIKRVARSLTKGMRRLVLEMDGTWKRQKVGVGGVSNLRAYPLISYEIAEHLYVPDKNDGNTRKRYARLTTLGLAVRNHLIESTRHEDA